MAEQRRGAMTALTASTLAFTVCFAAWMLNGVLVTFLVDNRVYPWTASEMGALIGAPVLTGSILRLPVGMLTDKYGGRPVFTGLLALCAIPMLALSYADSFGGYLAASLGFGTIGAGFAVGIAFTSVWFSKQRQGTALGVFGVGNAGAALTTLATPVLLRHLTHGATDPSAWRTVPRIYAAALVATAALFWLSTTNRVPEGAARKTLGQLLAPLRLVRVWRFGLYYFLVFGGFVALAQWLVPYYVNVYSMSIVTAGLMTSIFSLPSGVVRALGGWASDKWGPRRTLVAMFFVTAACCALLFFPKMDIESPGRGVMAARGGTVTAVSEHEVVVGDRPYPLMVPAAEKPASKDKENLLLPVIRTWQEPAVAVGDKVAKKQLLARGITHIYFQANVWVFTALVFLVGLAMGVGKAAVYKYIPDYFPNDVGVVGGLVGVIGGLGGFVSPILFGSMLDSVGLWTTTWMFLFGVTVACVVWLSLAVRGLARRGAEADESGPNEAVAAQ